MSEKKAKEERKDSKENMEEFFKNAFEADECNMLPHVSGFTIKGVIELKNKDRGRLLLGLLEDRNG